MLALHPDDPPLANSINVPIRVDHVPTMAGEDVKNAAYDALGRLFAIGYLKGLLGATGA